MALDLETTPTAELVRTIKRNDIEKVIGRSGCLLSILLSAIVCFVVFRFTSIPLFLALCLCFFGSAFASLFAFSTASYLADFRLRHHIRELNRRFGRLSIRAYARQGSRTVAQPTVVCLFHGAELPRGRQLWGSLWFGEEGTSTLGRTVSRVFCCKRGRDPWGDLHYREYEVPLPKATEIHSLIQSTKGIGKTRIPAKVKDGFPVTLAAVFGDGSTPTSISGNLCGLSDEQDHDDQIRLLRLVASVIGDEEQVALWSSSASSL